MWVCSEAPEIDMLDYRDLRLDIFRGLALLMIFVDHVEMACGVHLTSSCTLHGLLPCDAAEVFVFISGLVCGTSYGRVLREQGYVACQRKALRRALVLYVANLTTLFLTIDLILLAGVPMGDFYQALSLSGLDRPPWETAAASVALLYQPLGFDILTMYIQLLATLPALLYLESKWRGAGLVTSVALYVMAQFVPELNLPKFPEFLDGAWGTGRLFNHFAWGLLFFLAAGLGASAVKWRRMPLDWERAVCAVGVTILVVIACAKAIVPLLPAGAPFEGISQGYAWLRSSALFRKGTLGVGRLACFLILAYVTVTLIPRDSTMLRFRASGWLAVCGRNALPLFCFNLMLTYLVWPVVSLLGASPAVILGYEVLGCLLLISLGLLRERRPNVARREMALVSSVAEVGHRVVDEGSIYAPSGAENGQS